MSVKGKGVIGMKEKTIAAARAAVEMMMEPARNPDDSQARKVESGSILTLMLAPVCDSVFGSEE
jgi:ATP-dependent Lon protease